MSLKFLNTETIQNLKLVLKPSAKVLTMANGNANRSFGQAKLDFKINSQDFTATPHVMKGLTYDLILGRDWCDANGVIIDFNRKKLFFLKPEINLLDEKPILKPGPYAYLKSPIILRPFHETQIEVASSIPESKTLYVHSYGPMVQRLGIFTIKGVVHGVNNLFKVALTNLTRKTVILPKGTIVANVESYDDEEWEIFDQIFTDPEEDSSSEVEEKSSFVYSGREKRTKTLKKKNRIK